LLAALATSEEIEHQDIDHKRDIQEAMLWYNRVLGFKIEGGQGNHSHCIFNTHSPFFPL